MEIHVLKAQGLSERQLSRKNFLFAGADSGGECAAAMYS
jgi:hypothetical protein